MTELIVEQIGRVRRLTLNRPDKLNALSQQLLDELVAEIGSAEKSEDTHVIILRGAGRSFCAGYDMAATGAVVSADVDISSPSFVTRDQSKLIDKNRHCLDRFWQCRIPIIAQIHGHCLAGGTDVVLNCDFVIAADTTKIGYPPLRYFGTPFSQMWLYHLGPQWTKRLLLTGDTISGKRAAEIGLIQDAVPLDELDAHTLLLAERMSLIGRELLIMGKHVVNQGVELQGRSVLQSIAASQDAIGHASASAADFRGDVAAKGFAKAIAERNAAFGNSHIE